MTSFAKRCSALKSEICDIVASAEVKDVIIKRLLRLAFRLAKKWRVTLDGDLIVSCMGFMTDEEYSLFAEGYVPWPNCFYKTTRIRDIPSWYLRKHTNDLPFKLDFLRALRSREQGTVVEEEGWE